MFCRTTKVTLLFHVPNRTREILIPLLVQNTEDMYSVYVNPRNRNSYSETLGHEHAVTNHSQYYFDHINNWVHTNNREGNWRQLKVYISHVKKLIKDEDIDDYLSKFMLRSSENRSQVMDIFNKEIELELKNYILNFHSSGTSFKLFANYK